MQRTRRRTTSLAVLAPGAARWRRLSIPLAVALLGGCARPPEALRGEFPPTTVREVQSNPRDGERVRWGGDLVRVTPEDDGRTCFEVVSKPLDRQARPRPVDDSTGRFLACAQGFYDPAVWAPGREVTAVGTVGGVVTAKVGGYDYRYPRVDAEAVHLWPERRAYGGPYGGGSVGFGGGTSWGIGVGIGF